MRKDIAMANEIGDKLNRDSVRHRELSNCNFVKTVLMLIVVIYHCILYWKGNWFLGTPVFSAPAFPVFAEWLNTFHIYAFTLVSGYLFFHLKYEKGSYNKFLPFVANKVKRLLIPYIFVSVVWVIPFVVYFFRYSAGEIIVRFLFGTSPDQLWFLLMLFGVFVIFYPLSDYFEKHTVLGAFLALAFYGIGYIGKAILPDVFQIFRACMYIPFFWLGFKIRQVGSGYLRKIPAVGWIVIDVAVFVLMKNLPGLDGLLYKLLKLGGSFLLHIIGALMAFVILQKIADRVKWTESKAFNILSKKAMAVYLFHQQVICVLISLFNGLINPYLHAGVNFIGAMILSLLISSLLMKFRWTRGLLGEKG